MEEIKAGDIMIGNIVTVDNPQYHPKLKDVPLRVTGVQEKSIHGEIECCVNLEHVYDTYSQFLKFIRHIPLTEDILLKFGFTCHSDNSYSIEINTPDTHLVLRQVRYEFYPFIEQMAEFSSQKDNVVYLKYIKSVHELQNLFKILSGKELLTHENGKNKIPSE